MKASTVWVWHRRDDWICCVHWEWFKESLRNGHHSLDSLHEYERLLLTSKGLFQKYSVQLKHQLHVWKCPWLNNLFAYPETSSSGIYTWLAT